MTGMTGLPIFPVWRVCVTRAHTYTVYMGDAVIPVMTPCSVTPVAELGIRLAPSLSAGRSHAVKCAADRWGAL